MANHNIVSGYLTVRKRRDGVRISLSVDTGEGGMEWHGIHPTDVHKLPRSVLERMSVLELLPPPSRGMVIQDVPNVGRHWTYSNGIHYELDLNADEAKEAVCVGW